MMRWPCAERLITKWCKGRQSCTRDETVCVFFSSTSWKPSTSSTYISTNYTISNERDWQVGWEHTYLYRMLRVGDGRIRELHNLIAPRHRKL